MSVPPEQMQGQLAGQAPVQGQPQGGAPTEAALTAKLGEALQAASNLLYEEKVFDALVKMAKNTEPKLALSEVAVKVLTKVQQDIGELPMEILFSVGMTIVADAADALQQIGIEVPEQEVTLGLQMAIQGYLEANPNQFTKEELAESFKQLKQAVESGALEQIDESQMQDEMPRPGMLSGGV